MHNLILPTNEGPVVRVGDVCYKFKQMTTDPPNQNGGRPVFSDCLDCIYYQESSSETIFPSSSQQAPSEGVSSEISCASSSAPQIITDGWDTWLDQFNPDINYSTDTLLRVTSNGPLAGGARALIKFDIPYDPCPCTSARMFLYCTRADVASPNEVRAYRVVMPWDIDIASWDIARGAELTSSLPPYSPPAETVVEWVVPGCRCFDLEWCGFDRREIDHEVPAMGSAGVVLNTWAEFDLDVDTVNMWRRDPSTNQGMVLGQIAPDIGYVTEFESMSGPLHQPYLLLERSP